MRKAIQGNDDAYGHSFEGTDLAITKIGDREAVARLRSDLLAIYQPVNSQDLFASDHLAEGRAGRPAGVVIQT